MLFERLFEPMSLARETPVDSRFMLASLTSRQFYALPAARRARARFRSTLPYR